MTENNRILSIDVMRGLTLLLMLIVNDLNISGLPSWLGHGPAGFDGMGLAGWVFSGFLFIMGMAIPFSIGKRISNKEDTFATSKHLIRRTISLLIIGVLMLNIERVNPELTGFGKNLWAILMYAGVFLIWNNYKEPDKNIFTITGLKLAGIGILIVLIFKFKSGEPTNDGSLITSWWGILGRIGWGYLVSAFLYLTVRDNILNTVIAFIFFLALSILSQLGMISSLDPIKPLLGVIIDGNVPLIIIAGLITALILKKFSDTNTSKTILIIAAMGVSNLIAGFILRKWFIISGIQATPGWGLICIGISMILFALLYWITDIKKHIRWANFLKPAGENSLTAYLIVNILYCLISVTGVPVLFYKQSGITLIAIAGSVIWAILMIWLTTLLVRNNIKLKL